MISLVLLIFYTFVNFLILFFFFPDWFDVIYHCTNQSLYCWYPSHFGMESCCCITSFSKQRGKAETSYWMAKVSLHKLMSYVISTNDLELLLKLFFSLSFFPLWGLSNKNDSYGNRNY